MHWSCHCQGNHRLRAPKDVDSSPLLVSVIDGLFQSLPNLFGNLQCTDSEQLKLQTKAFGSRKHSTRFTLLGPVNKRITVDYWRLFFKLVYDFNRIIHEETRPCNCTSLPTDVDTIWDHGRSIAVNDQQFNPQMAPDSPSSGSWTAGSPAELSCSVLESAWLRPPTHTEADCWLSQIPNPKLAQLGVNWRVTQRSSVETRVIPYAAYTDMAADFKLRRGERLLVTGVQLMGDHHGRTPTKEWHDIVILPTRWYIMFNEMYDSYRFINM